MLLCVRKQLVSFRPIQAIGRTSAAPAAEGRKSVEPLAAVTAPERTAAQHQSLLHFVAQAPWSDQAMLRRVREHVLPSITRDEPVQAWIIDDTGFPKKGSHSVGVGGVSGGQLGKQNYDVRCQ